jgi:hypothetical protein
MRDLQSLQTLLMAHATPPLCEYVLGKTVDDVLFSSLSSSIPLPVTPPRVMIYYNLGTV